MLITSLVGKSVLSRAGEHLGYVVAVRPARDFTKPACLVCADEEEEHFYLPARAVLSAEDAVIAGNGRSKTPTGVESPVSRPVYTSTGESLGCVADMVLGELPEIVLSGADARHIPIPCTVLGETVIVYPTEEARRKACRGTCKKAKDGTHVRHQRAKRASAAPPAQTVQPEGQTAERPPQAPPQPTAPPAPAIRAQPQTAMRIDRTNLLGRRVKRSVFDAQGAPVALAGERITPDILARARNSNRLLALTVNTLTNLY